MSFRCDRPRGVLALGVAGLPLTVHLAERHRSRLERLAVPWQPPAASAAGICVSSVGMSSGNIQNSCVTLLVMANSALQGTATVKRAPEKLSVLRTPHSPTERSGGIEPVAEVQAEVGLAAQLAGHEDAGPPGVQVDHHHPSLQGGKQAVLLLGGSVVHPRRPVPSL